MANQQNIDKAAVLISGIVDRAKEELINDLYNLGLNIDNIPAFVNTLLDLDVEGTLRAKLTNATSAYANAHRNVLETTTNFADINPANLTSFLRLNEQVFNSTITNNIASHIRNEVVKGVQAGISVDDIITSVTNSSISNSQMQTLVNTTLNSYSRSITTAMMDEAPDDTLYHYIGPVDGKTRDICLRMASEGRVTRSQIEKTYGREVLIDGGGFNCRHKWERAGRETSEFNLPEEAKEKLKDAR